jgi:hypothetical protein
VRRLALLGLLALGLAACGGSAAQRNLEIKFGVDEGTLAPFYYVIYPDGGVSTTGDAATAAITSAEVVKLSGLVRAAFPGLKSEQCPGTLPDVSSMYITALGKTVTVHGTCEPGFTKLWNELNAGILVER